MRIGIVSFNHSPNDKIYRYVSCTVARAYCEAGTHEWITKKKTIRELVPASTISSNPERFLVPKFTIGQVAPSVLNPPGPQITLVLAYPIADQSSYAKRDFQLLWGCEQHEWQKRIGAHV